MLPVFIIPFFLFAAASAAPSFFTRGELVKVYIANFASGTVKGSVKFTATPGGAGVSIDYNLGIHVENNISAGPFTYHIHEKSVPADGNCAGTGGHFDPFKPNEQRGACDRAKSWSCEIGDLSGKLYPIPIGQSNFAATVADPWISLIPGNAAFVGAGRSIVIHDSTKSRIACANLVPF